MQFQALPVLGCIAMMKIALRAVAIVVLVAAVFGDINMQNPRGSNNRNTHDHVDGGDAVDNPNRAFDSETNNQSGYACPSYRAQYYVGSSLEVLWTQQHSCQHENNLCSLIVQYLHENESPRMREGARRNTDTPTMVPITPEPVYFADLYTPASDGGDAGNDNRVVYEPITHYADCYYRQRNKGLFTSGPTTQTKITNAERGEYAVVTRQNNNGDQYGYECAEERDYFPTFHPSPFRDIGIFTTNATQLCPYFQANSQNIQRRGRCNIVRFNNPSDCEAAPNGVWEDVPEFGLDEPFCQDAFYGRDNHLGYTNGNFFPGFNWTIPDEPGMALLRIQYNISSGDVDMWAGNLDSSFNGKDSPIIQDAKIVIGSYQNVEVKVKLQMNENQYFRNFEDRSHIFEIISEDGNVCPGGQIVNLGFRGRRGNIVNCYPATEYDYFPQYPFLDDCDCAHIQFNGAHGNTPDEDIYDNEAGPQATEKDVAGFAQILNPSQNYPMEIADWTFLPADVPNIEAAKWKLATMCLDEGITPDEFFDNSPARCNVGVFQYCDEVQASFYSTRGNNFTNRSQKGHMNAASGNNLFLIALTVILVIVGVGAAIAGAAFYARRHPESKIARVFQRDRSSIMSK